MDPVLFMWMYHHWLKDFEEQNDLFKNYSVLIGSFTDPEKARKLIKAENPDHVTTNFEELSQQILKINRAQDKAQELQKSRKRRVIRG